MIIVPLFLGPTALVAPATAAHAAELSVAVSNLRATNLVVTSARCTDVKMSFDYVINDDSLAELWSLDAEADVWRGDKNLGSVWFLDSTEAMEGTLTESYLWCPYEGFGTLKVNNLTGEYSGWSTSDDVVDVDFVSPAATTFTVKMGTRFTSAKISKKGKTRTISAKSAYFDAANSRAWKSLAKGTKVQLQRQAASGVGAWKSVKTVKVGSKGAVKTTYKTSSAYRYRFTYAGTSTRAASYSAIVKK